jgi:hypothetical protein
MSEFTMQWVIIDRICMWEHINKFGAITFRKQKLTIAG